MGVIKIEIGGSFEPRRDPMVFEASAHGHADAVARAIEWLAREVLPAATTQDHALHSEGHEPRLGWVR